jgi:hypothetical protein
VADFICPEAIISPESPPSSYAIAGVLNGEDGAWGRVMTGSLQRSIFIAPGLLLAGIRGTRVITGSLLASASITAWLFAYYANQRDNVRAVEAEAREGSKKRLALFQKGQNGQDSAG